MKTAIVGIIISMTIAWSMAFAGASPDPCSQCGMDRNVYNQSRMLIIRDDGSTIGTCSLHCSITALRNEKEGRIHSLKVADYATQEMIDAKTATWVSGGKKPGVMTPVAKWAFAKDGVALEFVKENGGTIVSFEQAMLQATEDAGGTQGKPHDHHGDMGPGSQMTFNPAFGDDIYHTHPKGMWMTNYRFMHTSMSGLLDGTTSVPVNKVIPMMGTQYGYMMATTDMTMDMHMVMVMYGLTDRLTLMGMANYQSMTMNMLMNMGMGKGNTQEPPMTTSGFGDTELRGIYQITKHIVGSLGLSIPTGDIEQEFGTMGRTYRAPYDMQLGSGTVDLKPALTFAYVTDDAQWNLGGQAQFVYHVDHNGNGYSLGDSIKVTSWLQRALGPATSWLRLVFSNTGRIKGRDSEIQKLLDPNPMKGASMPDADPRNYGGQRLDGLIGLSFTKGPFSAGVEGGVPLFQRVNGLQLETDWFLTAGLQVMF